MIEVLDSILLGENACEEFHKWFEKEEFRKWILNLLPEVEKCEETKQDSLWHIYNCLDHILKSIENVNKQTKVFRFRSSPPANIACCFCECDRRGVELWIGRVEKVKFNITSICKCFFMNFSIDIKKRLCYIFNMLI